MFKKLLVIFLIMRSLTVEAYDFSLLSYKEPYFVVKDDAVTYICLEDNVFYELTKYNDKIDLEYKKKLNKTTWFIALSFIVGLLIGGFVGVTASY